MDGSALYCENTRTAEALVLIHAGIADLRMWDEQVEAFKPRYRVIRFDGRGFGRRRLQACPCRAPKSCINCCDSSAWSARTW